MIQFLNDDAETLIKIQEFIGCDLIVSYAKKEPRIILKNGMIVCIGDYICKNENGAYVLEGNNG